MVDFRKSIFTKSTREKHSKMSPTKMTTLLNKSKSRKVKRKKKSFKSYAKKMLTFKSPVNKSKKTPKWKPLAILFGIILFFTYIIFFTGFFKVDKLLVYEGEEESDNVQIRKLVEPLRSRNIILIKSDTVANSLRNQIENLAELKVEKRLPGTIKVTYARFQKVANVVNIIGNQRIKKKFVINESGILMEKDKTIQSLPFINLASPKAFQLGDQVISQEKLKYMLEAAANYEEKFNMKVLEINYLTAAREVHFLTERRFEVWLDIQVDHEEQLMKLRNAIPKIDIYNDNLQYIDLRIQSATGQKIIYRRL